MGNEILPIYKSALELAVYMEQIVRGFEKYHKYTMGVDLRQKNKALLFGVNRANLSENRVKALTQLRDICEEMKMLLQLSKELQAFKSFKQSVNNALKKRLNVVYNYYWSSITVVGHENNAWNVNFNNGNDNWNNKPSTLQSTKPKKAK